MTFEQNIGGWMTPWVWIWISCFKCPHMFTVEKSNEFNIFKWQTMRSTRIVCIKMGCIVVSHMRSLQCNPSRLSCSLVGVGRDCQSVELNAISMNVHNHWIVIFCHNGLQETANLSVALQTSEEQLCWPPVVTSDIFCWRSTWRCRRCIIVPSFGRRRWFWLSSSRPFRRRRRN